MGEFGFIFDSANYGVDAGLVLGSLGVGSPRYVTFVKRKTKGLLLHAMIRLRPSVGCVCEDLGSYGSRDLPVRFLELCGNRVDVSCKRGLAVPTASTAGTVR